MQSALPVILPVLYNVSNVIADAYKIKTFETLHKNILHGINGLFFVTVIGAVMFAFKDDMTTAQLFIYPFSQLFGRQITFDIPLNLRRGMSWAVAWCYVSLAKPPKAITDRIEIWLFGYNGKAPTIIYLTLYVTLTTLYYVFG